LERSVFVTALITLMYLTILTQQIVIIPIAESVFEKMIFNLSIVQ